MNALKSKTLIVNGVAIVAIIITQIFKIEISEETQNQVIELLLNAEVQTFFLALFNFVNRFFTKKPISEKEKLMD